MVFDPQHEPFFSPWGGLVECTDPGHVSLQCKSNVNLTEYIGAACGRISEFYSGVEEGKFYCLCNRLWSKSGPNCDEWTVNTTFYYVYMCIQHLLLTPFVLKQISWAVRTMLRPKLAFGSSEKLSALGVFAINIGFLLAVATNQILALAGTQESLQFWLLLIIVQAFFAVSCGSSTSISWIHTYIELRDGKILSEKEKRPAKIFCVVTAVLQCVLIIVSQSLRSLVFKVLCYNFAIVLLVVLYLAAAISISKHFHKKVFQSVGHDAPKNATAQNAMIQLQEMAKKALRFSFSGAIAFTGNVLLAVNFEFDGLRSIRLQFMGYHLLQLGMFLFTSAITKYYERQFEMSQQKLTGTTASAAKQLAVSEDMMTTQNTTIIVKESSQENMGAN